MPLTAIETVQGSGAITVASGAIFDVSGGPGGANIDNTGGSVILRAPILTSNASMSALAAPSSPMPGLTVRPAAIRWWSMRLRCGARRTTAPDPGKHFDGIIDPAGFFDASGTRIISADANGLYPTSTADAPASGADLSHVTFYQTTLLDFVNNPFDTNAVASRFAERSCKSARMPQPRCHHPHCTCGRRSTSSIRRRRPAPAASTTATSPSPRTGISAREASMAAASICSTAPPAVASPAR